MRLFEKVMMLSKIALVFSSLFLFLLTGCAKHPSQSQLDDLERQKKTAIAAEKKVQEQRAEKTKLQKTLKEKTGELRELEKERDAVKSRLNQ